MFFRIVEAKSVQRLRALVVVPVALLVTSQACRPAARRKESSQSSVNPQANAPYLAPAAPPPAVQPAPGVAAVVPTATDSDSKPAKGGMVADGKTYCEFSWEEKPGYADYTTLDQYQISRGMASSKNVDRTQSQTLQGSGKLGGGMCANAKVLKTCYDTSVARDVAGNALKLVSWAKSKGFDLALIKMAFAYQETKLGALKDDCVNGSCNGIGIAQIITAYKPGGGGATLSSSDPLWSAIAFNVLTNLSYSSRVLQAKLLEAGENVDLVTLARKYNGNPDSSIRLPYGPAVQDHYAKLKACGL